MKKVIVIVAVLIVAGIGLPYGNGMLVERLVRQTYDDVNSLYKDAGSDASVEIIRYDRGFSSSEIEWKINLGSMKAVYGVDQIVLVDRASHQLFGIVSETSLEKNDWYVKLVNEKLGGVDPLHIKTSYQLTGKVTSTLSVDPFKFVDNDDTVDVGAGRLSVACTEGFQVFDSDGRWDGLEVVGKLSAEGMAFTSHLEKISTYVWNGSVAYSAAKAAVTSAEDSFEVTDLEGEYRMDFDKDRDTVSVQGSFGAGVIQGSLLQQVDKPFVRVAMNNMDRQGFEQYMVAYTGVAQSLMREIEGAGQEPDAIAKAVKDQVAMAGIQLIAASEKLLKKGLEFRISDLSAHLPYGNVTGDLMLQLNQDLTYMQLAPLTSQPDLAFSMFNLKSDLSFPAALVDDPSGFVTPPFPGVQTGLFEERDGLLVHHAETRDGKLYLNGKEVVLGN